ncbi:MAG: dihydrodipicolinate synthase family protein [Planctomycetota bacterium]
MMAHWSGVFPAITTQMHEDGSLDFDGTARHAEALIASGVTGIIFLGSLGENQTLLPNEKRSLIEAMVKTVAGRVVVLSGVAESSTRAAIDYVRHVEKVGGDGVMLMPPMLYRGAADESLAFFQQVTRNTGLPIMVYNNPIAYFNDITPALFERLADEPRLVAIKESSGDTRRITDLRIAVGDRYALFTGVDNLILEASILGIDGWVAGSGIAFPEENQYFWELTRAGRWDEARAMYRWFTPLLHLDVHTKFVQYIKLMLQECGLGREWVRAPRLVLSGDERQRILKIIHDGIRTRPTLSRA